MAGLLVRACTSDVTVSASTAKTVLMLTAPTNQRVRIHSFVLSFAGTSGTDNPALIRWVRATTAGTSSSLTLIKANSDDDETIQTVAAENFSAEPTKTDVLFRTRCHPQGNFAWDFGARASELIITGGERLALEITLGAAPSSTTVTVTAFVEE